jgi:hypothetical protein
MRPGPSITTHFLSTSAGFTETVELVREAMECFPWLVTKRKAAGWAPAVGVAYGRNGGRCQSAKDRGTTANSI